MSVTQSQTRRDDAGVRGSFWRRFSRASSTNSVLWSHICMHAIGDGREKDKARRAMAMGDRSSGCDYDTAGSDAGAKAQQRASKARESRL
jgi:hypothetical protein